MNIKYEKIDNKLKVFIRKDKKEIAMIFLSKDELKRLKISAKEYMNYKFGQYDLPSNFLDEILEKLKGL